MISASLNCFKPVFLQWFTLLLMSFVASVFLKSGVWTNSKNTPHLGGANGRSPLHIVENGI